MKAALIKHDKVTDELGNTVEIKLWKIPPTLDKPQGYKYFLAYIIETFEKRPLLANLSACPVAPEDGTGVRLKFQSSKY